jgi:hypothetical protein
VRNFRELEPLDVPHDRHPHRHVRRRPRTGAS